MNRRTLLSLTGGGIGMMVTGSTKSLGTNTPRYSDRVDVPEQDRSNPYGQEELAVQLSQEAELQHDAFAVTRDALDYWEHYSVKFAGYPITYDLSYHHDSPVVRIRFVESIEECGAASADETTITGCAGVVKDVDVLMIPVTVRITTGRERNDVLRTLIHEIGHTLGLTHDDEPANFMRKDAVSVEFR